MEFWPNIHKSRSITLSEKTSALVSNNHHSSTFKLAILYITPPGVDVDIVSISRAAMGLWKGSFRLI